MLGQQRYRIIVLSSSEGGGGETDKPKCKGFKFESCWLAISGFVEIVKQAWDKPLQVVDPVR
jgi:hypothetical protein